MPQLHLLTQSEWVWLITFLMELKANLCPLTESIGPTLGAGTAVMRQGSAVSSSSMRHADAQNTAAHLRLVDDFDASLGHLADNRSSSYGRRSRSTKTLFPSSRARRTNPFGSLSLTFVDNWT